MCLNKKKYFLVQNEIKTSQVFRLFQRYSKKLFEAFRKILFFNNDAIHFPFFSEQTTKVLRSPPQRCLWDISSTSYHHIIVLTTTSYCIVYTPQECQLDQNKAITGSARSFFWATNVYIYWQLTRELTSFIYEVTRTIHSMIIGIGESGGNIWGRGGSFLGGCQIWENPWNIKEGYLEVNSML